MFNRILSALRGKRSLEAGATGRRWNNVGRINSLNAEIIGKQDAIQSRAAHFARNNPHIAFGVNALVTNIIGPGIVPSSQHPDKATKAQIDALFARWTDYCDAEGQGDFYAIQALAVRQMVETGESFVRKVVTRRNSLDVPLLLQVMPSKQVPTNHVIGPRNNLIKAGIEFAENGIERVAYHVLPMLPDDQYQPLIGLQNPIRVPADEICHMFDRLEPGQLRGLSWLAPVLATIHELDQLQTAALVRAKLGNLICASVVMGDPGLNLSAVGEQTGSVLDITLEPGAVLPVNAGSDFTLHDPKESAHYAAFIKSHLMAVAAGMGIPYELIAPDLSGVNYSSIRAGWIEFWRKVEHWQHNIVVHNLCRPVWDTFIRTAAQTGTLDFGAYSRNPAAFHAVSWLPPKKQSVDPQKDVDADVTAINAGLLSRTQALAARGYNITSVRDEIAAEREADAAVGLIFMAGTNPPAPIQGTPAQ